MVDFLTFDPIFLPKIWGGNQISQIKNWNLEIPENCGEVWLVSDVLNCSTKLKTLQITLSELLKTDTSHQYFSESFREKYTQFPLLIKIIDAQEDLSIQVHPNDELATKKHQCLGKTESWIILNHENNAALFLGWKREMQLEEVKKASLEGWVDQEINQIKVKKNDLFFIPAGLVHSIGKGILLGEIQQTSDVTYRLFDFNRKGIDGKLRELHLEDSLEAISLKPYQNIENPNHTIESEYFSYSLIQLESNKPQVLGNNQLVWLIDGDEAFLNSDSTQCTVGKHEPVWISNALKNVQISSNIPITFILIQIP